MCCADTTTQHKSNEGLVHKRREGVVHMHMHSSLHNWIGPICLHNWIGPIQGVSKVRKRFEILITFYRNSFQLILKVIINYYLWKFYFILIWLMKKVKSMVIPLKYEKQEKLFFIILFLLEINYL